MKTRPCQPTRSARPAPTPIRLHRLLLPLCLGAWCALHALPSRAGVQEDLSVGTGYAADQLCTRILQSGDDPWRAKWLHVAPDLSALPLIWKVEASDGSTAPAGFTVSTWLPGYAYPRQAIHRPGLGCTVIAPGSTAQGVLAQPFTPVAEPPTSPLPWPRGDGAAETARLNAAQHAAIEREGDALFDESDEPALALNKRQNTQAFLVVHDGRLVFERMRPDYTADQPLPGYSLTKTLTTLLAGMLQADGRLQLDAAPPLPALAEGDKRRITWRQLLQMSSGLEWTENFTGYGPNSVMMVLHPDQGAWAASLPLVHEPGTHFTYSTGSVNIASRAMREVLGGGEASSQAFYDYYQQRLLAPLGARRAVIQQDASGTANGGVRGVLRPRDWLRLGQLILDGGRAQGRQLVPASHIRFMTTPSPAYAGYGAGAWLHGALDMPASMPRDIVVLWGIKGQYLMLLPAKRLAVLRMGVSFDEADTVQRMYRTLQALEPLF